MHVKWYLVETRKLSRMLLRRGGPLEAGAALLRPGKYEDKTILKGKEQRRFQLVQEHPGTNDEEGALAAVDYLACSWAGLASRPTKCRQALELEISMHAMPI